MKRFSFATLFVALLFLAVPSQDAHAQVKIGPRAVVSVGDISDAGGDFGIGADVRFLAGDLPVTFNGAFDYYFVSDQEIPGTNEEIGATIFTIDFNALYMFGVDNQAFTPYAGGGLGITRYSLDQDTQFGTFGASTTEVNLNIVGGAEFPLEQFTPFVQAQFGVGGDFDRFNIAGGLLFNL